MTAAAARYTGPLKALIVDWAGTIVDHGSLAPVQVFIDAFAAFDVALTAAEARRPMGLPKRDHIEALLANAIASASLCVMQTGCQPPTREQVLQRLGGGRPAFQRLA